MKMIENELIDKIKEISGNLLVIGVDNANVLKSIYKNNVITICNSLDSNYHSQKTGKRKRNKVISIKKIRKNFKRKRIDYVITNYNEVCKFKRFFIKDSIYICKKELILYGNIKEYELERLIKRYKRYNVSVKLKEEKNQFYLTINTEKAKNNRLKDFFYLINDTFSEISDFITDVLVN